MVDANGKQVNNPQAAAVRVIDKFLFAAIFQPYTREKREKFH